MATLDIDTAMENVKNESIIKFYKFFIYIKNLKNDIVNKLDDFDNDFSIENTIYMAKRIFIRTIKNHIKQVLINMIKRYLSDSSQFFIKKNEIEWINFSENIIYPWSFSFNDYYNTNGFIIIDSIKNINIFDITNIFNNMKQTNVYYDYNVLTLLKEYINECDYIKFLNNEYFDDSTGDLSNILFLINENTIGETGDTHYDSIITMPLYSLVLHKLNILLNIINRLYKSFNVISNNMNDKKNIKYLYSKILSDYFFTLEIYLCRIKAKINACYNYKIIIKSNMKEWLSII